MLAIAGTAAARVIVVASTGPAARAYPMGKSLPDDVAIRLRQRESVTILGRAGTRIFRGPGTFRPSDPVRAGPRPGAGARGPHGPRLGGIMMSTIERRPRTGTLLGAVGGVPSTPEPPPAPAQVQAQAPTPAPAPAPPQELPTIWDVDPARGGTICLRGAEGVRLARSARADSTRLQIVGPGGASRSLDWPAESTFLAWPGDLPVADGATFELRGAGASTRITFQRLANIPPDAQLGDPVALAELFLAKGCRAQLDRLVEATLIES